MKYTISCSCDFYIRLFGSDLDADDNNSLVSEFSENEDFEIEEVDTGGMDEDWRLITVTTAQADEVCITLNKFIRNGVICGALCNLVPFVQFKKHEKNPWRSVNFSKGKGFSQQLYKN